MKARCCSQTQLIFSWKANQICILGQYNWCEFPSKPSALSTWDIPKKYLYKPKCTHKPNIRVGIYVYLGWGLTLQSESSGCIRSYVRQVAVTQPHWCRQINSMRKPNHLLALQTKAFQWNSLKRACNTRRNSDLF